VSVGAWPAMSRRFGVCVRATFAVTGVAVLGAVLLAGSAAALGPVSGPSAALRSGLTSGRLASVVAVSADDAWAVGYTGDGQMSAPSTGIVLRWDGTSWSPVQIEMPGTNSWLYSVGADSPGDVWAAGLYDDHEGYHAFVEHFDGSGWSLSSLDADNQLVWSISAQSPGDVWAVSLRAAAGGASGEVFHYDGSAWTQVPTPPVGDRTPSFTSVTALSPSNAWLVGYLRAGTHTLAEHWDGSTWSVVHSKDTAKLESLNAVAAASASSLWGVGQFGVGKGLIMHSHGGVLKPYAGPVVSGRSVLLGVTAPSTTSVFAVGLTGPGFNPRAVVEWRSGSTWNVGKHLNLQGSKKSILDSVTATSSGDVWAVGAVVAAGSWQTVIEHWNGTEWERFPS
jgi:hypothetical protein